MTVAEPAVAPMLDSRVSIETPALIVDIDLMNQNITEMTAIARDFGVQLRPHIKTHKTPEIAKLQIAAGAVGIMCAKLSEAEIMADGGIENIAIGNQIVGQTKIARLLALSDRASLTVTIDALAAAAAISEAFVIAGKRVDAYLEIDTGHKRAGVLPEDAIALAGSIAKLPGVRLIGIMTHEGKANAQPPETIEAVALEAGQTMVNLAAELRRLGIPIEQASVGSTPCARYTPAVPGVTEMRPGTYVFRDASGFRYGLYGPDHCAARIVATVTSRPAADRAVLDAGTKTISTDLNPSHPGHGYIVGHPTAVISRLSEEHGVVDVPPGESGFELGARIEIIPNHICPCVNLRNEMVLVERGAITGTFRVAARGMVQ